MNTQAQAAAQMSAIEILETYCPMGDAIEGVSLVQNWDNESTEITFSDGSKIEVCGPTVTIL